MDLLQELLAPFLFTEKNFITFSRVVFVYPERLGGSRRSVACPLMAASKGQVVHRPYGQNAPDVRARRMPQFVTCTARVALTRVIC